MLNKALLDYWVRLAKTSNAMDHVILGIVITYSYMIIFKMYLQISVPGQCQTNIYLA